MDRHFDLLYNTDPHLYSTHRTKCMHTHNARWIDEHTGPTCTWTDEHTPPSLELMDTWPPPLWRMTERAFCIGTGRGIVWGCIQICKKQYITIARVSHILSRYLIVEERCPVHLLHPNLLYGTQTYHGTLSHKSAGASEWLKRRISPEDMADKGVCQVALGTVCNIEEEEEEEVEDAFILHSEILLGPESVTIWHPCNREG